MGLTCIVVCASCPAIGPPIGDFGYLGRPSLDTTVSPEDAEVDVDDRAPFGFFYQTLYDAGINTDELEAMAGFLRSHHGHTLSTYVNDGLEPPVDNAEAVEAALEAREEHEQDPLAYKRIAARVQGSFVLGQYALQCRCGETLKTHPAILRPLGDVQWTAQMLRRFRQLFVHCDENSYHLTDPIIDPSRREESAPLRQIDAFVSTHLAHGVTARVVPASLEDIPSAELSPVDPMPSAEELTSRADWTRRALTGGGLLSLMAGVSSGLSGAGINFGFIALGAVLLVIGLRKRD